MHTPEDARPAEEPSRYRPRFTLRRLLQGMTLAAFLVALLSQSPVWVLLPITRVSSAILLGGLIATAFVCEGRARIAAIGALAAMWPYAWGASTQYLAQAYGLGRISPRLTLILGLLLNWGGVAISGAAAYWVSGWLTNRPKSLRSTGDSSSPSD